MTGFDLFRYFNLSFLPFREDFVKRIFFLGHQKVDSPRGGGFSSKKANIIHVPVSGECYQTESKNIHVPGCGDFLSKKSEIFFVRCEEFY